MALPYPYSTFATSRSFTYSYVHIKPHDISKPYILFLHGFPGSSYDWRHQILYLQGQGYGIIVPDLLGYGGTSKPLDVSAYSGKGMAEDFHEVLKHEDVTQIVGIAHDWGSFLLSRLANYFPNLFIKLAFLDVGYAAPGHGLNAETVQFVNKMVKDSKGFEVFGYFLFFNEEDAAKLMDEHIDSLQSLMHSTDNELGKKYMGATGGIRTWLSEGKIAKREEWLEPEAINHDRKLFAKENGGYAAAINWYRSQLQNINAEDEKAIPEEAHILKQPVLLITTDNFISASADFKNQMKAYAPRFETKKLEASHWVMLQKKDEVNEILGEFVGR